MNLQIIIGSTREGRKSLQFSKWIENTAKENDNFKVELVDLMDYELPMFNEPVSPRYNPERKVTGDVKKFLDKLSEGDAFVFVTPEYNHSLSGVLKNALDYTGYELDKKPAAVATHGSVGGARAAEHLKMILSECRAVIVPINVHFNHFIDGNIDQDGNLMKELKELAYGPHTTVNTMLDELAWYGKALKTARDN
ncbi:MAG: NAD(P)H-dependent oxidoreductase [Candidatus Saccharibacteria bacterium]